MPPKREVIFYRVILSSLYRRRKREREIERPNSSLKAIFLAFSERPTYSLSRRGAVLQCFCSSVNSSFSFWHPLPHLVFNRAFGPFSFAIASILLIQQDVVPRILAASCIDLLVFLIWDVALSLTN